ncbi:hypothetical protein AD428_09605 [Achromobacter sp. DMS1]|nr:hypothetical protein AD428_09605 [Achromobacter sp. DMS1]
MPTISRAAAGRPFEIPRGASLQLLLGPGACVICLEGSVDVSEPAHARESPAYPGYAWAVRLNAGESHVLAYGGLAAVTALTRAELVCVVPGAPLVRLGVRLRDFLRRRAAQAWRERFGAMHKISK